ncbi:autotransporter-associated beta strand repeat-containing protein [Luteolibacter marinus]|uniref:autotransporter-associated beta strand repeat-containing protein n=1 Tax=Luteolibacter marinus TaxID=2776705 RepID=UPI00186960D0|nr:family 16 glycosylhydrolase [Luteolibacter marinus]
MSRIPTLNRPEPISRPAVLAGILACLTAPPLCHAQLPAGNWQYSWGDDFSGTTVNTSKWDIASPAWTMPNSLSTASASKVRLENGALVLDATRTATSGNPQFSSGSVSTYSKPKFTGSYIEARIWLPNTPGSWPAFWGLYDGWPPEMDIMEYPVDTAAGSGYALDQYHTAFHYTNPSGSAAAGAGQVNPGGIGDLSGAWHTFGANWVQNNSVTFYFDGQQVSSFNNPTEVAEMANMYLILDYAVGGWPGTPNTTEWPLGFTAQTKVDWVRVWKSATASSTTWTDASGVSTDWKAWENGGSWNNGAPNLGGVTANFGTLSGISERLIDIIAGGNGPRTASIIHLDGSTRYKIGWPTDRLVLGCGNGGAIQPAINVAATTTTDHEFWTGLEWAGTLNINNSSAHPLLLTGPVAGGDSITIDGPGAVVFENNGNSYNGTIIDSGAAGPGIARARSQNALGFGPVVIGEQGNATTARLELENGATLPNAIFLNGRNNDSAGIVNNSGTNTLTGIVSSQVGGDRYWLQSDAGMLTLTGGTGFGSGGPAIRSNAGGTRTFTLRGNGDGKVNGTIENGSAATVNLVKAGNGTWTLGAPNTYSGTTTLSAGTLVVDGTTGSGAMTLSSNTTLGGGGTINGNLTAPSNSTVRVGDSGFPLVSATTFFPIDDFNNYPAGSTTAATGGVWNGEFVGTGNSNIVASDSGLALETKGGAAWRGGEADLTRWNAGIDVDKTATVFFRMKAVGTGFYDIMTGLSPDVSNIDTVNAWQDFAVMPFVNGAAGSSLAYKMGDAGLPGDVIFNMSTNVWYNVWLVVNNDAETYSVYWSTGTNHGTFGGTATIYRNGFTHTALDALAFMAAGDSSTSLQVDDIYIAAGSATHNPLNSPSAPPVPLAKTLNVGGSFTLASGSTLELDVSTGAFHDKLVVGGAFNASGTLKVTLDPAQPAPVLGDSFDLFDSAGGTIAFASYNLPALAPGLKWDTSAISTGVLSVVTDHTQYAGWALDQGFEPGENGPDFDIEPDGVSNALEWLLNGNPTAADPGKLPQGQRQTVTGTEWLGANPAKQYLSLTATVRKNITGWTLAAQAASSPDLLDAPGSSDSIYTRQLNNLGDFEEREWIYKLPMEDLDTGFMRLKLTED